jgi:hypothetical protein
LKLLCAPPDHHHLRAGLGKLLGDRRAYAAAAAGHQHHFLFE